MIVLFYKEVIKRIQGKKDEVMTFDVFASFFDVRCKSIFYDYIIVDLFEIDLNKKPLFVHEYQ